MTDYIIKSIELIPHNRPVVGMRRHAEREKISRGNLGNEIKITEKGIYHTLNLQSYLNNRLIEIYSSPVLRCIETAQLLRSSAKYSDVKENKMLGDPGIFVENSEIASHLFLQFEPIEIAAALINKTSIMPGFCLSIEAAVKILLIHLFEFSVENGIYLFIIHDSILGIVNGILFPDKQLSDVWPDFLETLFLYKEGDLVYAIFRGQKKPLFSEEWLGNKAHHLLFS